MYRLSLLFLLFPQLLSAQLSRASFDLFVEQQLEAFVVPGIAIGVIEDGKIIMAEGYGLANLETERPVSAETQFAIGSATKSFTAAGIALLADQGKVILDHPVRNYLPEFALRDDYASGTITVRDLLRHNSGLPRHDLAWYGHDVSRAELVQRLRHLQPTEQLGKKFQYQNLMYITAGHLIERVSGESWEAFTHANFARPLNMNRTNFSVIDMAKDADYALPYGEKEPLPLRNLDAAGPAGSINSTVNDMLSYLAFHLGEGEMDGNRILSTRLLDELHRPQMLLPEGFANRLLMDDNNLPAAYGLGWFIGNHNGRRLVEHGGNIDGYTALVSMLPDEGIGVVLLSNANGTALPYVLRNRLYDELLGLEVKDWTDKAMAARASAEENAPEPDRPVPGTRPSLSLSAYAGNYNNDGYGELTVRAVGDSLYLNNGGGLEGAFAHFHHDVFANAEAETVKVQFRLDVNGKVEALELPLEPSLPPIRFERQASALQLDREQFYTGEYQMGGATLTVYKEGEQLILVVPGQPEYPLTHKEGSEYTFAPGFGVIFEQSGDQPAPAFELLQPTGTFKAERLDKNARAKEIEAAEGLSREAVADYLGTFRTKTALSVTISYANKLQMEVPGQPVYTLLPTEEADRFRPVGLPGFFVQFERQKKRVPRLLLIQPNGNFSAERVE